MSLGINGIDPTVRRDMASRPTGRPLPSYEGPPVTPSEGKVSPENLLREIPAPPRAPELGIAPVESSSETPEMAALVEQPVNKLSRPAKTTQASTPVLMQVLLPAVKPQSNLQPQAFIQEKPQSEIILREKLSTNRPTGFAFFWSKAPADLKWITLSLPVVLCVWFFTAGKSPQRPAQPAGSPATQMASVGTAEPFAAPEPVVAPKVAAPAVTPKAAEDLTSGERIQPLKIVPTPKQELPVKEPAAAAVAVAKESSSVRAKFEEFKKNLRLRATVALEDDFHSGLSAWAGRRNWASSWGYDNTGLVRAGQMAIYKPSANLTNYYYEITTSLDRRSVGWIYRASDLDNYYASRVVVTRPGPVPVIALERYAVINGKAGKVEQVAVPSSHRGDGVFTVGVQVNGNSFTTYWQGQIIDSFSDDRLTGGGVGLYALRGEESRIFRIALSHNNDLFGRICAMLAPVESANSGSASR